MSNAKETSQRAHVVALDGSEDADKAFVWALKNLPKSDKLVLVHGIHTQPLENPHMDWMDQATTLSREERARLAKERHKALFSHYEKRCKEADRECSFETIKFRSNGELANNICRVAEEDRASTVIAGSRGLGLYDRVMLGSVSTALLNRCRCSVLIARDSS